MGANRDDKLVAQSPGTFDDIDMTIGQGIEGTRIERDAVHIPSLRRAVSIHAKLFLQA
jgi:hypothetical protein